MEIQLSEWKAGWRIVGSDNEWQVQKLETNKGEECWRATNHFPSLGYAMVFAYEKALRASKKKAETISEVLAECNRVRESLVEDVRRANESSGK